MHAIKNVAILTLSLVPRLIYPVIQNVEQMHGERVGGRWEAWSEMLTSGVNLEAWYIIL